MNLYQYGDGKTDIAVGNYNGNSLSIFLNTSVSGSITASSFAAKVDFPVTLPRGVAAGDFDGDGKPDIAVTSSSTTSVIIFKNTSSGVGNINFVNQLTVPTGAGPFSVAIGDIDYDGKPDLAVTNNSTTTVSIMRNTSSGIGVFSFAGKIDFTVGSAPYGITLADMDGDRMVDVIVPNCIAVGSVTILRNISTSGTINFAGQVSFSTDTFPFYLSVGDLNKDGKADIAVANGGGSLISILQSTSSGIGNINFTPQVNLATIPTANTVAINDMDGDGNPDIVLASNSNILSFFYNTSPVGGTISFGTRVDFTNSTNARGMAIADFDGDGKNDVLTGNNGSSNISVFRNDPLLAPTVQATNVVFTATAGTTTTASWTNGNGSSRAVFMYAGSNGSPVPVDFTTYTANAAFGTGTQIGTTGWYCVYKGTGTTVNITGLSSGVTYQLMTVEYNGSIAGNEVYFSAVSTGNSAGITTIIGPGGITANLKLWLKANSSVTPATQGAPVTAWNDQSGNNNNASYSTPIFSQTVLNPTYQLNSLNFNAALNFAGTSSANFAAIGGSFSPALTSNNISAYVVFLMNATASGSSRVFMVSLNDATSDWQNQVSADLISRNGASNVYGTRNNTSAPILGPAVGSPILYSTHFTTGNQWLSEFGGNSFSSTAYVTAPFNSAYYRLGLSTYNAADYLNGNIAEVILYDADQSALAGHNQIESYLSLKYGLHKVGSYVNSSGTTIWNTTLNALYHNDVFGIGQDDGSGLNQTLSNSTNTGAGDGTGQSGKGNIVLSAPSLVNNAFLVIGHDTSALTEIVVPIAGNLSLKRIQRIWKVQTTGTPGSVILSYDVTGLTYSAQSFRDYVLLVDPTGLGDFTGGSVVKYSASSLSLNKVVFRNATLPTGAVFTFQTLATPTVQATNVVFTATTGTTTTANWTNGNGTSRAVFIFAGSTGSPVPVTNTAYTANTAFGTGTQIGTTGWYCVYNGTGTTVNVTGLTPATTYQVMTVEYNGTLGNELYLSTISTGNPAGVTTLSNVATLSNLSISQGILTPVFATATTAYTAIVPNAVTSLTLTPTTTDSNATVKVNGITVTSGSASGAINLVVGPNVITTVVTAQDGTTIGTYTVTVTRTVPTIITTGTLAGLTTIYGTPSASTNFSVLGTDMASAILVTSPTGFEVSTDNVTFTNTVTVGAAGIIASTPVYIRLKGTTPAGSYSGNIVLTSTNATTVNVATVSSTVNKASLTITTVDKSKGYGAVNPTLTASYTGFVNGDTAANLATLPTIITTAVTASPVGTYPITASGAVSSNYTISYVAGIVTVTPVALTITAANKTKAYGAANPALTVSYTGFVNGDTAASLTTQPAIATTAITTSPVGTYPITASGAVGSNYTISYVAGTLTVTPVALTITAANNSKAYGAANPALTVSYTGFVNGDTASSFTTPPAIATTAITTSPVGAYPITASGAVNPNYTISYVAGTLTVTAVTLTITADNKTKAYGVTNPALTVSYSGFVNGDTAASLTTPPTISTTALIGSDVGTYPITAIGAVASNYTISYIAGALTVTSVALTITAADKTKGYGAANPALTVSYSGFVNGDTAASLATLPAIATTAVTASPVGTYPITASGAVNPNYTISYVAGTLTVTPVALTITAANKSKVYGAANPALTVNYTGFVNGDTAVSLTTQPAIATTALTTSPVGTYPITASGAVSSNYTITYVAGTLTVTPVALTITAANKTKVYGAANPALTVSYTGFVNGDTAASLTAQPTITTTAVTASSVGTYPITASGAVGSNYTISYVAGTLTVSPVALTITVANKSKTYGAANPVLTVSYTGFVNGDTAANLTPQPAIATTAITASPVGTYPITASGAVNPNYTISYVAGTLTVTAVTLTITADNKTKVYGAANPALTVSYSGFVNGDTAASLTTPPTISTTALIGSDVGTYPITAIGAVASNYTISYIAGTLTVTPVALTITAADKTKGYGAANPALTVSYSGFVNGDTPTSLATLPAIATTAVTASLVGTYPITASGAVGSNYTISYVAGTLTVTPAALTITAANKSKVYGAANPALTVNYTGFVNGDTAVSLTTQPTITTTALTASPAGTYPITASGAVNPNYTISYVAGTLTVTPVVLTITAANKSKAYGAVNPALTVSYSGFVNGDTASSFTTPPAIATPALTTSPVGAYPITASGAVNPNYTISYVAGTLTVTAVTLTITADNKTKAYGAANPGLTVSYAGFVNGDTAASLTTPPTISTTALIGSDVGTYPITAIGAVASNYTIAYVSGTLTVTPVVLTITPNDGTKTYGSVNPTLTASYSGFLNGDTAASLDTLPTISTSAITGSAVGTYTITASGAVSSNYTINYGADGTLTVTPVALTITANNQIKTYGDANPTLTVTYAGFANGDTVASLTTLPTISTTAVTGSAVGTYPITASGAASLNYSITYIDGTLTVTTATLILSVTADSKTKTYGSVNPPLTVTYTGFVNGDTSADLTTQPILATTAVTDSPVGTYPITASGATSSNYIINDVDGTLTVTPVALTITIDDKTKAYGDANPTLTATYAGFVNGDTEIDLTTQAAITTTGTIGSVVGTYPITASGAASINYTISYVAGNLTITPVALTITADNHSKIYGDANPALTVSYTGFVNGDTETSLTTPPTITTTADLTSPVGGYSITASGAVDINYTISYVGGSLTVTPVVLTITADNQSKIYGDANPALTVSYLGFVNGDTAASLLTPPTVATTAAIGSPVGSYPIVASAGADPNYTFNYIDGNLTVTVATLTITAENKTKVYGDANPALTVSYLGFVNGDTAGTLLTPPTVATTAAIGSPVGSYPIVASAGADPNYIFNYIDGNLTVTVATLTVTAENKTKVYGDANPALTVLYSGFVNGETAASLLTPPTVATTATIGSSVGTYPIVASAGIDPNYTFTYIDGNLTVTPVVLTITADNQSKIYGDANPSLTVSYSGFANGDTAANLTTAPTITTTADTTSSVGTYSITASGAVDPNYTFTYIDGNLTVTPVVLTITADNQSKIYGDANPSLTVSYSGFANGDTAANLTTAPTITTTADTTSSVGTYSITASGAVDANYTISYVDGSLTVTPVVLTITADNQSKIYGDANPSLTVSYSGFTNGDTAANLTTAPTIITTADTTSPVGTYSIAASGAVDANYTISYVDGSLTVTPIALTITADNQSKIYGDANPTLTVSYSGFVNGDTEASLTTAPTIITTADTTSPVGTYSIAASGAVDANYTISYVDGSLTVTPIALTITADNQSKIYGDANPTLTVSYSGFVNGDTEASLATAPIISTTAGATSEVGMYPITASGAIDANYTISYIAGTLTVTPANLAIAADDKIKIYGSVNPAFTFNYTGFVNGDTEISLTTLPVAATTDDATTPVGIYPLTVSGASSANYTIGYTAGATLTITPANLAIAADDKTKIYGSANPAFTFNYTGFVNGDTEISLTTLPVAATTADATTPVGIYPLTVSGASSGNYTIGYTAGATLTITPENLVITSDDQSKTYGSANPTLTASYSGFVNGDTEASLTTAPSISTTANTTSGAGTYPITASGAVSSNYTITYGADGTLTVTPVALLITSDDQSKTYGSANPTLTASYSGFVNGDTEASLTTAPTISTTANTTSGAGTYPITASGAVSSNYTITYGVDGTLTVTPVALLITSDDQIKTYGSANPTLTASYSGFVNGDSEASLTTAPTISTTANTTSGAGTYPITASGAVSSNYTITYGADGTLTVTPVALIITSDDQSKTYGSVNPTLTASYSGFVNGDTEASLTTAPSISTTANTTSGAGTYPITASGAVSSNYTITYGADGTLTVTPVALLITSDNQSKTYGSANPTLTASYSGFVNGDTEASLTTAPTISTTANTTSGAGTYPITASGAVSSNYTITYGADGTLTVTPVALIITSDDQSKTYGSVNPTLTASYSGFVNGDTEASLTTAPSISTTANTTSGAGTYPITASGAVSSNYTITYGADGTLTVTPVALLITSDDQIKTYGSANPTLTASYSGFVNGDTASSFTTPPTISTTAVTVSSIGTYPITASGAVNPNYTISYLDGNLTVTTAILTITADNQSKIYGDVNPTLTASYSGFVNGDTASSFTTPPMITTTAVTGSSIGTYPITANGAINPNYAISYLDGNLTVTTAILTITADNQSKTYGSANPTLTASYTGFVNGDTASSFTTPPIISTTAVTGSSIGTYPITASGAVNPNYTISYLDGNLTVTTAILTITADNQSKTYGSANPTLTASYSGFVNGDTEASLTTAPTISTTANTTSGAGTYPITASGAVSSNYTITYGADGTLTVTPVALLITSDDQSKTYGSANPTLTASYSGFVNGDIASSFTTPPTITTTAITGSSIGTYPITASGAVNPNYTISYLDGNLTVTTAILTITADNQSKIYGDANPILTASYSGFVNGDTASSFTTPPIISTTAVTGSSIGTYPITASGAVNPNYTISYLDGNLTVTTAILTITADNQSKTYGSANPTLTASYTGFVNGDTASSFTTPPIISTTAVTGSSIGTYPITASGAVNPNYTISYLDGNLTVTTAILTITADNQSKIYGDTNPTLTASYSGFVNGDTASSFTTPPTITTTAVTGSSIGTYPITASGAVNPNYTISYLDGSLTVTTAILTITADNQSKIYGDVNPTLTASYSGFVNGDTASSFTTPPTISTTAVTGSSIGTYPITASGAVNPNYTISYLDGNLTVTTAILTITADNQSKTYGSANPTLTASYTGFVNGDTAASFATPPTITTTAITGSSIGTYPITASGAVNPNYTISYLDGNLTVTTAILTITADNQSKTYGDVNPTLTASYSGFVNGDTAASFATPPTISTTAVTGSSIGTYPITASGAVNPNYTISYLDGNLTVTRASLTITADDKTRVYGATNPVLTASYSGFVNGDTVSSLTTPPVIATIANATSPVGVYAITVNGAADDNYSIIYVTGLLTITSATDVNLTSLSITNGALNPAFSPNIVLYNVTVANNISTETITVIADDPLATITINGIQVQNGSPDTVSLLVGLNKIVINVIAEDGLTTKTYTINVTREGADIATLSNLSISEGTLNPAFESDIKDYKAAVKYNVNSITVLPTVTDPSAIVTVNGVTVSSGSSSLPIILSAGENTITTVVTAQDGATKETYTIVVYKGASPETLVISNVLSPNGDGKNDFWEIEDIQLFPNNKVTVFDRAGRIIYSKNGYSNEWDGAYSGSPLNNDTYYYLIELGDDIPRIKGFITIIRD